MILFKCSGPVAQEAEHRPFKPGVAGSNPAGLTSGPLAQQVEQRTLNPWVAGSSPVRPTKMGAKVAELADALDLGSSGLNPCGFKSRPSHHFLLVVAKY